MNASRLSSSSRRRVLPLHATWMLAAAVALAGCESSSTGPSGIGTTIPAVLVLGDSLAVSPSMAEAFPAQLQVRITRAGLNWRIMNASVSGDSTTDALRRLPPLLTDDVRVIVVALGANDGLQGADITVVERNLAAIIEAALARNIRVLLTGMETPPTRGFEYSIAFHNVFPTLAQRFSIPLVPFLLAGVALIPEFNGPDLVHPNAAGAQRIADTVWRYLEPMLRDSRTTQLLSRVGTRATRGASGGVTPRRHSTVRSRPSPPVF
jgi:acyl-CoA thioesterase-1